MRERLVVIVARNIVAIVPAKLLRRDLICAAERSCQLSTAATTINVDGRTMKSLFALPTAEGGGGWRRIAMARSAFAFNMFRVDGGRDLAGDKAASHADERAGDQAVGYVHPRACLFTCVGHHWLAYMLGRRSNRLRLPEWSACSRYATVARDRDPHASQNALPESESEAMTMG